MKMIVMKKKSPHCGVSFYTDCEKYIVKWNWTCTSERYFFLILPIYEFVRVVECRFCLHVFFHSRCLINSKYWISIECFFFVFSYFISYFSYFHFAIETPSWVGKTTAQLNIFYISREVGFGSYVTAVCSLA